MTLNSLINLISINPDDFLSNKIDSKCAVYLFGKDDSLTRISGPYSHIRISTKWNKRNTAQEYVPFNQDLINEKNLGTYKNFNKDLFLIWIDTLVFEANITCIFKGDRIIKKEDEYEIVRSPETIDFIESIIIQDFEKIKQNIYNKYISLSKSLQDLMENNQDSFNKEQIESYKSIPNSIIDELRNETINTHISEKHFLILDLLSTSKFSFKSKIFDLEILSNNVKKNQKSEDLKMFISYAEVFFRNSREYYKKFKIGINNEN